MPFIFSDKAGGSVSANENRTLAKFPSLTSMVGLRSGLENWINDNAGFREQFSKINAYINYDIFNTSPNDRVKVGKDGWFFLNTDNNLDIPRGTYPLTQEILEKIKANQERIQRALKKKGIEYVLVLTPSKASVYPEMINGGNFKVQQSPVDIVTDYLKKNTTINVINTKPALLEAKKNQTVYFKTDTHWNQIGAYIGYKTAMQSIFEKGLVNVPPVSVQQVPILYKREYSAMMGNENLLPPEKINATQIINPQASKIQNEKLNNMINQEQVGHNLLIDRSYFFHNPSVKSNRVLMYGDSFFGSWNVEPLVAENCSDLFFVWSDYIKNNIVTETKPDVLIYERTERFINTLAQDCDPRLLTEPLKNAGADLIVDQSEIHKNTKSAVKVTIKNRSSSSLSEDGWIRLCILADGKDAGYRVKIPDGVEIKPGEQYTFTINDISQYSGNSSYLEFQMAEEGVQYFGQKKRVEITK